MYLDFNAEKETPDILTLLNNTKVIYHSCSTCVVCGLDEKELNPGCENWDRYILPCAKHQAHTRCYRRWLFHKKKLNCPYCGDIAEIETNRSSGFKKNKKSKIISTISCC